MAFRVLTGLFGHESNAFSRLPTAYANFEKYLLAFGDDVPAKIKGASIEPAGVELAAEEYGWELVRTVVAWATPSGPVAQDAWDACAGAILDAAMSKGPFDGVLLNMHGAMATVEYDDAEGELLKQLRAIIGPDAPVAITLDLHANVTDLMTEHADIICAYRTYPHIDQIETSQRAAAVLDRTMKGDVKPACVTVRRDTIEGLDDGRTTTDNPMTTLLKRAADIEESDSDVLLISVQAGFTPANLYQAGPTVSVTGNGTDPKFRAIADEFMDYAWETRHFDSNTYLSTDETVAEINRLLAEGRGKGPIVVADFSDNPGSGAYGDSTLLLAGLLKADFDNACFGTICDQDAAAELVAAGEGATVTVNLGGKVDATFGAPLDLTGTVTKVTDGTYVAQGPRWKGVTHNLGPTAVFKVGGMEIVVASNRVQLTEIEAFTHAGIDPRERDIVAVKSMQHFRAAYAPIAREILICDAGALSSKDISKLPFTRLRRPIFPLDLD
ncbi:MAG: M81 family metallopeptidase [Rhodospirillales bacterium]|nr:M81 family metallopeptidase [Rhodospirillales bacterium]MBO6785362.1 M81 family metallopeptidase [Rhodospirillales bacterium]